MICGALFLASGFEEIEAISVIDILRRAGIELVTVGVESLQVMGAHNIQVSADILLKDFKADNYSFIVFPGGMGGTERLMKSELVIDIIRYFNNHKKLIAAICAAPMVLDFAQVLPKSFVCYPSIEQKLKNKQGYLPNSNVVIDGNIITSKGPATAMEFSLALVEILAGKKMRDEQAMNLLVTTSERTYGSL